MFRSLVNQPNLPRCAIVGTLLCSFVYTLVSGTACTSRQSGLSVPVSFKAQPIEVHSSKASVKRPSIDAQYLTINTIELIPCTGTESIGARLSKSLNAVISLGISTARAHSTRPTTTPLRISTPHILDLANPEPRVLGHFYPPPNIYCEIEVTIGPADPETESPETKNPESGNPKTENNLEELNAFTLGRTLSIRGSFYNDQATSTPFTITSRGEFTVKLKLIQPLSLLEKTPDSAHITVSADTSQWFEGLDLDQASSPEQSTQLFARAISSFTVRTDNTRSP